MRWGEASPPCTSVHTQTPLHTPGGALPPSREALSPPLSEKGWVSRARLPHSTDWGRRLLWPRCAEPAGRRLPGGFPPPATLAGLSSFMSLSSRVPAAEPSSCGPLPAPSLSPSCLWGGAEQLGNSCKAGWGWGVPRVPPATAGNSLGAQEGCRRPGESEACGVV